MLDLTACPPTRLGQHTRRKIDPCGAKALSLHPSHITTRTTADIENTRSWREISQKALSEFDDPRKHRLMAHGVLLGNEIIRLFCLITNHSLSPSIAVLSVAEEGNMRKACSR